MMKLRTVVAALCITNLVGCGSSNSGDSSEESTDAGGGGVAPGGGGVGTKYPIHVRGIAPGGESASAALALAGASSAESGFRNRSIASGTPEEFRITMLSMSLATDKNSMGVPIFLDATGKEMVLRSGRVDLSSLFTKISCLDESGAPITLAAGETCECGIGSDGRPIQKELSAATNALACPAQAPHLPPAMSTAVDQIGTFNYLSVRFKARAKAKGCVTGHFMYKRADQSDDRKHTFCTRADKSIFASSGSGFVNSDYESVDGSLPAELMDITLSEMKSAIDGEINLMFPIKGGLVVDGVKAPSLTLAIDLGRALRFQGVFADHPVEGQGESLAQGAHFFPLLPSTYQFVFAGAPGKIAGYSWTAATGLADTAATVPNDRVCPSTSYDCHPLAGWMTTIFSPDGKPLLNSLLPDDDAALTILKGANVGSGGIDTSVFTAHAGDAAKTDVGYSLGSDTELAGTIYGFDFGAAVGSEQVAEFETSRTKTGKTGYGKILFKREL